MSALRLISALAAGLVAMPVAMTGTVSAMTELEQCTVKLAEDALRLDAFDLGNGMTSYLENIEGEGTFLIVTSCHTGRELRAPLWTGSEDKPNDYPATMEEFEDATADDGVVSIGQLAELFEARDVPTDYRLNRNETCACAAAYPGLRGTKQGYDKQ